MVVCVGISDKIAAPDRIDGHAFASDEQLMYQPGDLEGARAHELGTVYDGVLGAVDAEIGYASFECLDERNELLGAERGRLKLGLYAGTRPSRDARHEHASWTFQASNAFLSSRKADT